MKAPRPSNLAAAGERRLTFPESGVKVGKWESEKVGTPDASSDSHSPTFSPAHLPIRLFLLAFLLLFTSILQAQTNLASPLPINLNIGLNGLNGANGVPDVDVAIKILFAITLLTLAPSIILLMTCFMRIAIVLSFVRTALSLQSTPANQVIVGLSLFLTLFIMAPTWERIDADALTPYRAKQITSDEAL